MSTRPGRLGSPLVPMFAVVIALGLALSGCATPVLQNGVFRSKDTSFRVGPIPEQWEPLPDVSDDPELASYAFRNPSSHATVVVAARCHRAGDDVPLRALTQHLYIGFTDRESLAEREFMLDGRAALRTDMVASLDGVPQHLVFVVL